MATKTREQLYRQEAESLLRDISTYRSIKREQWKRLYPGKEEKIERILGYLVSQGRIIYRGDKDTYYHNPGIEDDPEMMAALWVLADFGDKCEFHCTDAYPSKIVFFAEGETYEIVYVPIGREAMIVHALNMRHDDDCGKKILIVGDVTQIEKIELENTVFCTVDASSGTVQYYMKE